MRDQRRVQGWRGGVRWKQWRGCQGQSTSLCAMIVREPIHGQGLTNAQHWSCHSCLSPACTLLWPAAPPPAAAGSPPAPPTPTPLLLLPLLLLLCRAQHPPLPHPHSCHPPLLLPLLLLTPPPGQPGAPHLLLQRGHSTASAPARCCCPQQSAGGCWRRWLRRRAAGGAARRQLLLGPALEGSSTAPAPASHTHGRAMYATKKFRVWGRARPCVARGRWGFAVGCLGRQGSHLVACITRMLPATRLCAGGGNNQ